MSSRPTQRTASAASHSNRFRDNLLPYITSPTSFPPSVVIHHNPSFVWIRDKYPKSYIHTLIIPRDASKSTLHPFDAFDDSAFLGSVRAEAQKLRSVVAKELKRKLGEQQGRDWEREVMVGVHARPSLRHLHVHVLSREMCGEGMKKAAHYNSFRTGFFVHLDEFPLPPEDERRRRHGAKWLEGDLVCWRCGRGFGRSLVRLKEHLGEEFEEWKRAPIEDERVVEVDEGEETE